MRPLFSSSLFWPIAALALAAGVASISPAAGTPDAPSPGASLETLAAGNARFAAGQTQHPNHSALRRAELAQAQHPFATVLTCADSRVAPETVFDQGLGDLFVIRVAGNVAKTDEIGSIDYAVGHLGTPVLLVLGHTKCGAVAAVAQRAEVPETVAQLVAPIVPVVDRVRVSNPNLAVEKLIEKSVEANVWNSIAAIYKASPTVRDLVKAGKLRVVGGVYHLDTGHAEILGAHPQQSLLVASR